MERDSWHFKGRCLIVDKNLRINFTLDNQLITRVLNTLVNEVRGFREAQAVIAQGQGNNNQNRQPDPNDLVSCIYMNFPD